MLERVIYFGQAQCNADKEDVPFWLAILIGNQHGHLFRVFPQRHGCTESCDSQSGGGGQFVSPMNLLFVPPFQCNAPLCSVFTHPIPKHTLFLILVSLVSSVLFPWLGSRAGFFRLVDDLYNTYRSAVGSRQTLLVPPTPPRPLPTKKLISPLCVGLGRRGVKYPPTPCPGGRGEHFYVINKTCFTEKKQTLLPL